MNFIKNFFNKISIKNDSVYNPFLKLFSGTFFSQIIPILITPILTRIYTPAEFGIYSFFMGIIMILSNITNLRLEIPIIIPKTIIKSNDYFKLSFYINILFSVISFITILLFGDLIIKLLDVDINFYYLLLIPFLTFIIGVNKSLYYFINKQGKYNKLSLSPIVRSSITNISNLVFSFSAFGLLIAQFFGRITTLIFLIFNEKINFNFNFKTLKKDLKVNRIYVITDTPAALISSLNSNGISVFATPIFGSLIGGSFALVNKFIGTPINLISKSFLDVFKKEANQEYQIKGHSKVTFKKVIKGMIVLTIIPFILFFLYSEDIFIVFFGDEWLQAGFYAKILTPMIFLKMLSRPLSFMFYIVNKQHYNLIGQLINFLFLITSVIVGFFFNSPLYFVYTLSVLSSIFYIAYIYMSYKFSFNK
jgi:O-antigen/teichoic acid export membrane protein